MLLFLCLFSSVVSAEDKGDDAHDSPADQRKDNIFPSEQKRLMIDANAFEKNQQIIQGDGGRQSEKCSDQFSFHGIVLLVLFDIGTSIAYPP